MNEEEINEKEQSIRKDRKFIAIKMKIDGYCKYNNKITNEMEQFLNVLDEKYNYYQYYLNLIHISIIFLSSMASFLLASQPYIHSSHAGVHLTSLCISTYTSLLLSVSKFMKLEEKKESLYRLRSAFAEFLIEICSRNDLLESWASHNYWKTREDTPTENMANQLSDMIGIDAHHSQNVEICFEEWNDLERKLKEQMRDIIVKKQELCSQYAQEMDNQTKFRSEISSKRRVMKYKLRLKRLEEATTEKDLEVGFGNWLKQWLLKGEETASLKQKEACAKEIKKLEEIHEETNSIEEEHNPSCFP